MLNNRKREVNTSSSMSSFQKHMGYSPSLRSRWQDIGQVVFLCVFMDRDGADVDKHAKKKKTEAKIQPSDPKNLVNRGCIIWDEEQIFPAGHVA